MKNDLRSVEAALQSLRTHGRSMPPTAAMQFQVLDYDGTRLQVSAPLAANVNDKGSAFGGSLTSLMTFAGWGLVTLRLQLAGLQADVFVADSTVYYRKPLYTDLQAEAVLASDESWDVFLATFLQRGRARIHLQAQVLLPEGEVAAELAGRYVAIAKG